MSLYVCSFLKSIFFYKSRKIANLRFESVANDCFSGRKKLYEVKCILYEVKKFTSKFNLCKDYIQ